MVADNLILGRAVDSLILGMIVDSLIFDRVVDSLILDRAVDSFVDSKSCIVDWLDIVAFDTLDKNFGSKTDSKMIACICCKCLSSLMPYKKNMLPCKCLGMRNIFLVELHLMGFLDLSRICHLGSIALQR